MPITSLIHRFPHQMPQARVRMFRVGVLPLVVLSMALVNPTAVGQEATTRTSVDHLKRQIALLHEEEADVERQQETSKSELARAELELARLRQELNKREQELGDFTAQSGPDHPRVALLRRNVEEQQKRVESADDQMEQLASWPQQLTARLAEIRAMRSGLDRQLREAVTESVEKELAELGPASGDREQLQVQIHQAEIRKREAQYTGLRKRLVEMERMGELGLVKSSEVAELETQLAVARADLEKAQAEFALRQLDDERGGFDDRNAADSTAAAMQTEFFRGYLDAVERYAQLSSNPKNAGVAAVVTAADMLRDQPPQATIDFFAPLLEAGQFPDYTVETAVRLQLAEAYRAAGQTEQALETLRALIVAPAE